MEPERKKYIPKHLQNIVVCPFSNNKMFGYYKATAMTQEEIAKAIDFIKNNTPQDHKAYIEVSNLEKEALHNIYEKFLNEFCDELMNKIGNISSRVLVLEKINHFLSYDEKQLQIAVQKKIQMLTTNLSKSGLLLFPFNIEKKEYIQGLENSWQEIKDSSIRKLNNGPGETLYQSTIILLDNIFGSIIDYANHLLISGEDIQKLCKPSKGIFTIASLPQYYSYKLQQTIAEFRQNNPNAGWFDNHTGTGYVKEVETLFQTNLTKTSYITFLNDRMEKVPIDQPANLVSPLENPLGCPVTRYFSTLRQCMLSILLEITDDDFK